MPTLLVKQPQGAVQPFGISARVRLPRAIGAGRLRHRRPRVATREVYEPPLRAGAQLRVGVVERDAYCGAPECWTQFFSK